MSKDLENNFQNAGAEAETDLSPREKAALELGLEKDADWPQIALANVEKHQRDIRIVDANGRPIPPSTDENNLN